MTIDTTQPYPFTCKLTHSSSLNEHHVRWAVRLTHIVARWNRNTEWNRRVVCVTNDDDEILRHISIAQRDAYLHAPTAFKDLGATWPRKLHNGELGAAIWIRRDQDLMSAVDTLAHELAHVVTKSVHGWGWRRMCVMLTPMIRAHVYHDMSQMSDSYAEEITKTVMQYYRTTRLSGQHTNSLRHQVYEEMNKHIKAARRAFDRFNSFVESTLPTS